MSCNLCKPLVYVHILLKRLKVKGYSNCNSYIFNKKLEVSLYVKVRENQGDILMLILQMEDGSCNDCAAFAQEIQAIANKHLKSISKQTRCRCVKNRVILKRPKYTQMIIWWELNQMFDRLHLMPIISKVVYARHYFCWLFWTISAPIESYCSVVEIDCV